MSNKDDEERFWNFLIYKVWATDKEMDEMMPALGIIILIGIVGAAIWYFFF